MKYAQTIVVSIKLPDKNRITHVSVPFLVGAITGWNDKKIAIYSHQISFVKKTQLDKYSTALLVRTALEEISHISQANNILKKYLPNRPVNLMLSDAKTKKHVHIEVHSEELAIAKTNKNYLVVSTFPSLLTKYMKTNNGAEEFVKRSKMRYSSAITYVKDKKTIDVELLITLLKDTRNGTSVKITGNSISNKGTYQSFIFDMIKNILYISNGKTSPASLTGKYVKIKLVD